MRLFVSAAVVVFVVFSMWWQHRTRHERRDIERDFNLLAPYGDRETP